MFEVLFFIETGALMKAGNDRTDSDTHEASCLTAFDALRGSVYAAASKAYAAGRRAPMS